MQIQEKVFYWFDKITFPRKNAKLFVMAVIKRKFSLVAKSYFAKKMLSIIQIFLA